MQADGAPLLTVVISTRVGMSTLADTWPFLARQTIAPRMEVIVVGPAAALEADPPTPEGFASVRAVGIENLKTLSDAYAEGARHARASIVAYTEDHVYAEPDWAEALVAAHGAGDWAAVGPVLRNANPGSMVSWADFVQGFGPWAAPAPSGEREFLPGHNTCYRRDVLLARGEGLAASLTSETVFHWDLRREGRRLWLEPRARIAHLNFGRLGPWLRGMYVHGRAFAAQRSAPWPFPRRLAFALASPLIPVVRLVRCLPNARRCRMPLRAFPVLILGLAVDGAGQAVGTLAGEGPVREQLGEYEYERTRFAAREA